MIVRGCTVCSSEGCETNVPPPSGSHTHVDADVRQEWRLLYSSEYDGKSFNTLLGRVSESPGPTLFLIKCVRAICVCCVCMCVCGRGGGGGLGLWAWVYCGCLCGHTFYVYVCTCVRSLLKPFPAYYLSVCVVL